MSKRGLTYKGNKVRINDEEVVLPWSIVRAIASSPAASSADPRSLERKLQRARPRAFANPLSHGYGGSEAPWPFDTRKALVDGRYRAGIRNAIGSNWVADNWRAAAQVQLLQVLEDLLALEDVIEDLRKEDV